MLYPFKQRPLRQILPRARSHFAGAGVDAGDLAVPMFFGCTSSTWSTVNRALLARLRAALTFPIISVCGQLAAQAVHFEFR